MPLEEPVAVFIDPSAGAPKENPLAAATAREGAVVNPGVRTVTVEGSAPSCPRCSQSILKMRMNKKQGQRVYCSNPQCNYDQSNPNTTDGSLGTKVITNSGRHVSNQGGGVKIKSNKRG